MKYPGIDKDKMQFTLLLPLLCMLQHCGIRNPQELAPMVKLECSTTMLNLPSRCAATWRKHAKA